MTKNPDWMILSISLYVYNAKLYVKSGCNRQQLIHANLRSHCQEQRCRRTSDSPERQKFFCAFVKGKIEKMWGEKRKN